MLFLEYMYGMLCFLVDFMFSFSFCVGVGFTSIGLLFSVCLLCIIMDIMCCMTMVFISLNVCFIAFSGMLSLSS